MKNFNLKDQLFGGGTTLLPTNASAEECFLHILENGVNWQSPEGHRSTRDFFDKIDLPALVKRVPDLLNLYSNYTAQLLEYSCDSGQDFIGPFVHDDDLPNTLKQLLAIEAVVCGMPGSVPLSADSVNLLTSALDFADDSCENFEEFGEQSVDIATKVIKDLRSFLVRNKSSHDKTQQFKP